MSFVRLGALSKSGLTIDYYAETSSLKWSNGSLQKLHDALVDADFAFQKMSRSVVDILRPIGPLLASVGIPLTGQALDALGEQPCPTAGYALLLELGVGGRPFDSAAEGALSATGANLRSAAVLWGTVAAVCLAVGGAGLVAAGTGAALLTAGAGFGAMAAVAGPIGIILGNLSNGQMPSRSAFGDSLKASAKLAGKPAPSEREIDEAYAALGDAAKRAGFKPATLVADQKAATAFLKATLDKPAGPFPANTVPGTSGKSVLTRAKFVRLYNRAGQPTTVAGVVAVWRSMGDSLIDIPKTLEAFGFPAPVAFKRSAANITTALKNATKPAETRPTTTTKKKSSTAAFVLGGIGLLGLAVAVFSGD